MTGYGKGESTDGDISYRVEIKSLNSKSTDIRCKLPDGFLQEEILIRQTIQEKIKRGRIEVVVTDMSQGDGVSVSINEALVKAYYQSIKKIAQDLQEDTSNILPTILRNQELLKGQPMALTDAQWNVVKSSLESAINELNNFRKDEGQVLSQDLKNRVEAIQTLIPNIANYEKARIDKLRERIQKNLEDVIQKDKIDENRFEQEVLFYIEKLDISEEKVRLVQHCKYFLEQIANKELQSGKVLGFIAQEMGREINTLGAKAQDSDLQKLVVSMKDELEKIKEQIANVL